METTPVTTAIRAEKPLDDRIETAQALDDLPVNKKTTEYGNAQLKSSLDRLSYFQAVVAFKKAALICLVAAFTAATDGGCYVLSRVCLVI
jgi:hypothetical protein